MGWCSGTAIFDGVIDALLETDTIRLQDITPLAERVADILWDSDWDCEGDSKYYDSILHDIMEKRGYLD